MDSGREVFLKLVAKCPSFVKELSLVATMHIQCCYSNLIWAFIQQILPAFNAIGLLVSDSSIAWLSDMPAQLVLHIPF